MEIKKKKSLRKKIVTFGLLAVSILSFGAFGFATFGNSDVLPARAETYDLRPATDKVMTVNNQFQNYVSIDKTSSVPVLLQYVVHFPTELIEVDSSTDCGLSLGSGSMFQKDTTLHEYYFGVGRTKDVAFFDVFYNTDFETVTNQYNIEYRMYSSIRNRNVKGYTRFGGIHNRIIFEKWDASEDLDTDYYYFSFLVSYRKGTILYKTSEHQGVPVYGRSEKIESMSIVQRSMPTIINNRELLTDFFESDNGLGNEYKEFVNDGIRSALGYTASEDSTVTVEFIEMNSFTSYEKKTIQSKVDATYLGNKDYVISQVLNTLGINDISYFNAKFTDKFVNSDDKQYNLEERIVRQAIGYDYTYDGVENTGKITIKYSDFLYSDLALRVSNNDPSNLLTMNVYTSNATVNNGIATLTWFFNDIQQQLYNTCQWLFELKPEHIMVTGVTDNVTVTKTSNTLSVSVPIANQNDLFGLTMTAVAEIIEDVNFNMTIKYLRLNEDFSFTEVTTEPITILYSEVINLTDENFMIEYGDLIEGFTSNSSGIDFISYKDVVIKYNSINKTCTVEVVYNYNTLICAENSNGVKSYMPMNSVSLNYKASDFNFNVPAGYRISNITSEDSRVKINFNEKNPAESTISFNCSTALNEVITIKAELTDKWFISVEYLAPYKDSAFSVLTTFNGSIKVSEYADVYALTKEDLAKIIGVNTLDILGLSTVKTVTVTFDGTSTYDVGIEYTKASMRKMNSDGSYEEVMIPLTSYAVWCDLYGQEWSILWLNSDKKIFNYENDVDREKLYGFFSVATFKEQITDLNSILSAYSTNGCRTVYNSHTVQGSEMYKWFNRNKNNVGALALSHIGIWGCEITNEDNCQVYSYFFYLDGTSDLNYVANNGADDYDDTDSATQNKVEDVTDWFEEKANNIKDWFTSDNKILKVIKIVLIVFACLLCLLPLAWIIKKIINIIGK